MSMQNQHTDMMTQQILTAPPTARLFVYGTLMSTMDGCYGQAARSRLAREAPHRLPARTQGSLYELGQFPGLVTKSLVIKSPVIKSLVANPELEEFVHGQLLVLPAPCATLAWLDDYEAITGAEDDDYSRLMRSVRLVDGSVVDAWVYVYRKTPVGLSRIPGGRWQPQIPDRLVG
jgi:gamma-glutamylcyclotransferase (GGCT)/AIG2-like uncharacterized protein YtfP